MIGPDALTGDLAVDTVTGPTTGIPFLVGTFTVTSASWAFVTSGFRIGATVPADSIVYNGKISTGQINGDHSSGVGTIALLGSGLLAVAGILRRRLL